jgi:hypothetical protein
VKDVLKQTDASTPLLFVFDIECPIRSFQVNQDGLKLNGTYQLLVRADDISILGGTVHTVQKNS